MGRRKVRSFFYAGLLMAVTLALLAGSPHANAAINLGWGGAGIWPQIASANSQRWIRFEITWDQNTAWTFNFYAPGVGRFVYDINGDGQRDNHIVVDESQGMTVEAGNGGSLAVPPNGASSIGVNVYYTGTPYDVIITIGPFSGYWQSPYGGTYFRPNTIGALSISSIATFNFSGSYTHWNPTSTTPTYTTDTVTGSYETIPENDTALQWYAGPAAGIDPLSVNPTNLTNPTGPDQGSGSDRYVFRVRYQSRIDAGNTAWAQTERCRWMGDAGSGDTVAQMPSEHNNAPVVDFVLANNSSTSDQSFQGAFTRSPNSLPGGYDSWFYYRHSDPSMDQQGYETQGYDAGPVLIIDDDYDHPHFMMPENPAQTDPTQGQVFRYEILPTDYQNWLDNVFLFPMDPSFQDPWDAYGCSVFGRPASNNYVDFFCGPHKYEFWSTPDIWPVSWRGRGYTPWVQIGRPGYEEREALIEANWQDPVPDNLNPYKIIPLYKDPNFQDLPLQIVSYGADQYSMTSGRLLPPISSRRFSDQDVGAGGFGYPYNSQSGNYPKVNPVLSAYPFFGEHEVQFSGPTSVDSQLYSYTNHYPGWMAPFAQEGELGPSAPGSLPYPFNPNADKGEPWQADPAGTIQHGVQSGWDTASDGRNLNPAFPGYLTFGGIFGDAPNRYTNDGTISPNYADITPDSATDPFVGGKWTDSTTFTFRTVYWQSDNVAPTSIQVHVRQVGGTYQAYTMQKVYPDDSDYTNGCVFYYQLSAAQLPGGGGPGDYNYYFTASDGNNVTLFPNRPNAVSGDPGQTAPQDPGDMGAVPDGAGNGAKYYWFRVNHPPVLSDQSVSPSVARDGSDFTYNVSYADVDEQVASDYRLTGVQTPSQGHGDRVFSGYVYIDLSSRCTVTKVTSGAPTTFTYDTSARDASGGPVYFADGTLKGKNIELSTNGQDYEVADNQGDTITLVNSNVPVLGGTTTPTHFWVPNWVRMTMTQANTSDDYRTAQPFSFNTASRLALAPGLHRYYFTFTDDWGSWLFRDNPNVKVQGQTVRMPTSMWFEGPEVQTNTAPILSNFRYVPKASTGDKYDGTTATPFTFYVTYTDHENDPPALIRLGLDGTADNPKQILQMTPQNPQDTVYSDGAVYMSQPVRLAQGQHIIRGQASDGSLYYPALVNGKPVFAGPPATDTGQPTDFAAGPNVGPNTPPTLSYPADDAGSAGNPPGLDPNKGTPDTTFTYTVIYTDKDQYAGVMGNPPAYVEVFIDGQMYPMTQADPSDTDYTNGATFTFTKKGFVAGAGHTYFFVASDGADTARLPSGTATPNYNVGPDVAVPPEPPLQLVAADTPNDNGHSITLNWNASLDDGGGANNVTSYRIYRATSSGGYGTTALKEVPASGQPTYTYVDDATNSGAGNEPADGQPYYYVVTAVSSDGFESVKSNEAGPVQAVDNIAPAAPSGLAVSDPGIGGTLDLTWTLSPDDPASGKSGAGDVVAYHIWRATASGQYASTPTYTVAGGVSTFRDTGVTDGTTYYYVVTAFDGTNESARSNEASATPSDKQPPQIVDRSPQPDATGVAPNVNIAFSVNDTGAGVDASTLKVTLERKGRTDTAFSDVSYKLTTDTTQMPHHLGVIVDPDADFSYYDQVKISVTVSDLSSPAQTANETWQFTVQGPPTNKIAGTIQRSDNNQGLAGVKVTVGNVVVTTDANGDYEADGLAAGTYQVTPQLDGWAFTPTTKVVQLPPDQIGVNFTAVPGYDISGKITLSGGAGLPGVQVTAGAYTATTDANGNYVFKNVPAGGYTIVPSLLGYTFTPGTIDVQVTNAAVTGKDFAAAVAQYSISGQVADSLGSPVDGVTVKAADQSGNTAGTATTNAAGGYTIAGLGIGSYTVTASKTGYSFNPTQQSVDLSANVTGVNFEALPTVQVALGAGLNFVGVPVTPLDQDPLSVFGANSKIARYDPSSSAYVLAQAGASVPDLLKVAPGAGFWVRVPSAVTLNVAGRPLSANASLSVPVGRGWNMLANPFGVPMPWASLGIVSGMPLRNLGFLYEPSTNSYVMVSNVAGQGVTDTVPANAAFWIYALDYTNVNFSPVSTADAKQSEVKLGAGDFLVPIVASTANSRDAATLVGVMAGHGLKVENPPAFGSMVDMYISDGTGAWAASVLPSAAKTMVWNLDVQVPAGADKVSVSLPDLSGLPADKTVLLTDVDANRTVYMRTQPQYTFSADAGSVRHLQLSIEDRGAGALVVSAAQALQQGERAVVTFSVSKSATVTAQVLNIAGRKVATLAAKQVVAAGANSISWNLRNAQGSPVPAGRYMVQIVAVGQDGQQVSSVTPLSVGP